MLNTTQTAAFFALLDTMTEAQRAAFLDMVGSHIENVETSDDAADGDPNGILETEGHTFIVALRDATIVSM